jgi:hypothetical protein
MAFFDEREQAPRAASRRRARRGPSASDRQQLMIRRAVAAGVVLLILILLVLGIRGCVSSAADQALKDYNASVSELVRESDSQVTKPLLEELSDGTGSRDPIDLQTQVNQLRVTADEQLKRAEGLSVPDEMKDAQAAFLLVMDLRADAVAAIASQIPAAYASEGNNANAAINRIAGQMQALLTSDVIYSQRVIPDIQKALDDAGIGGQQIASSRSLPDLEWLDPAVVAERMGAQYSGGGGSNNAAQRNRKPAPGPHGTVLQSVSIGEQVLVPDAPNEIPAGAGSTVTLTLVNDENEETNVKGSVSITGGSSPINAEKVIPKLDPGAEATIEIPLPSTPPAGTTGELTAKIDPVPGEETEENNTMTFQVTFTG